MIIAVGIDSIEINRFNYWNTYQYKILLKLFSAAEIDYCLSTSSKYAERFAVRFAAKEAFFKAFSACSSKKVPFLTICKNSEVIHTQQGAPHLQVNWDVLIDTLTLKKESIIIHLSLTHDKSYATAAVILEKIL